MLGSGDVPPWVQGQSPWSGGVGGKAPRSWKHFVAKVANFCISWKVLWKDSRVRSSQQQTLNTFEMDVQKDDVNQLDRTQNQQVNIRGAEADMSFPGRSQKKKATILWPCSASWQSVHTCSTWHHRWKQTSRKTTETLDRWHQTMDRNIHPLTDCVQHTIDRNAWRWVGDLWSSDMKKDQGKARQGQCWICHRASVVSLPMDCHISLY